MISNAQPTPSLALAAAALVAALAATHAAPAAAQYKWIGPDGKVQYGDQPPPEAAQAKPLAIAPAGNTGPALPWSLQQVAAKYPVTLYTSADCSPCELARKHLQARGIPFAEKQLAKAADVEAFKALGFAEPTLPSMTVGKQRAAGFEAGAWNGLLDAAGYPAQSALPKGWKAPAAQPMVAAAPLSTPQPDAPADTPQRRAVVDPRRAAPGIDMPPAPQKGTIRF